MKKTTVLNLLLLAVLLAFAVPALVQAFTAQDTDAASPAPETPESLVLPPPELPSPDNPDPQTLRPSDRQTVRPSDPQTSDSPSLSDSAPPEESANFAAVASIIANGLRDIHFLRLPFDQTRSAMAWTNYLAALDIDRMYFRQEDLDALDAHRLNLRDEMNNGDLSFANEARERFMVRVRERNAAVQELLSQPFDFTVDEDYTWRRRDAPWPASATEQDDLWRRRIKNELLVRIINRKLDEEEAAKKESESPKSEDQSPKSEDQSPESETPETETPNPETRNPEPESPEEAGASPADPAASADTPADSSAPSDPVDFLRKRYDKLLSFYEDSDSEYFLSRFFTAVCMSYDPHSDYFSPVSQEDFDINMQLSLQGIGATLQTEDGAAKITEIIPGGPADRDTRDIRLVPGDRIIAVAQEGDAEFTDILHWPLYKAVRLIRGPKGTRVRLLVQCADDPTHEKTRIVELVRDEVKLEEQAATSSLETFTDASGRERRMGVITLPTFYAGGGNSRSGATARSASADIVRLLAELNASNIEGLILDLRGNGGGALKEAVDLTGLFIRTGPVVQVQEYRRTVSLKDFNPAVAFQGPLIVLVDRLSASASEIVAGALQDYGRAIVIGDTHTHGKGTVQQVMPIDNGNLGSIKVTNAGFFRITGDSTQLKGVTSDICLPSAYDYYSELGEDKLPNAIPWRKIGGTAYRRVSELAPAIQDLQGKSDARRASDERWQTHLRRLDAVKRINDSTTVSLQIDKRTAQLREEREAFDDDDEFSATGSSDDDDDEKRPRTRAERMAARRAKDVVLDEALRILGDFVDYSAEHDDRRSNTTPIDIPDVFRKFF